MSLSPFHGIFSFGQDQATSQATDLTPSVPYNIDPPNKTAEKVTAVAEAPQQTAAPEQKIGKIAVDIYEQGDYYIIRAPIAGVRLSDLDIEVDGKVITISGARRLTDEVEDDQFYLQECYWGQFSRSITMPCTIDPKKIKATFSKDSILKLVIPKEDKVKIVRINEGG